MSVDRRDLLKGAAVVPFGFAGCLGLSNSNSESSSDPDEDEQIELTFDGGSTATTDVGGGRKLSTQPKFHFSEPTTVDQEVRFEIENLDTGDQMTVEVEGEDSFETEWAKLGVVNPDGTFPNETFPSVVVVYPDSFERFETSVEGDDTTFTQIQRASYRTTMYRADAEVGSTEYEMTMNHESDPKYTVTDETIKASFAAGNIPVVLQSGLDFAAGTLN